MRIDGHLFLVLKDGSPRKNFHTSDSTWERMAKYAIVEVQALRRQVSYTRHITRNKLWYRPEIMGTVILLVLTQTSG